MLRLPSAPLRFRLNRLESPAVLFVHPWEFVDLRREKLRIDCRWRTGDVALKQLGAVIGHFQQKHATFVKMSDFQPDALR